MDINNTTLTTDDDVELANDQGYCVTKCYKCSECSLVNYGRDCHNRPLYDTTADFSIYFSD